jgi:hypothetical protein
MVLIKERILFLLVLGTLYLAVRILGKCIRLFKNKGDKDIERREAILRWQCSDIKHD